METVFLIDGTSTFGQADLRSTAIIRHTAMKLDVGDCAIIGDVGGSSAGGAIYQEGLSPRV